MFVIGKHLAYSVFKPPPNLGKVIPQETKRLTILNKRNFITYSLLLLFI